MDHAASRTMRRGGAIAQRKEVQSSFTSVRISCFHLYRRIGAEMAVDRCSIGPPRARLRLPWLGGSSSWPSSAATSAPMRCSRCSRPCPCVGGRLKRDDDRNVRPHPTALKRSLESAECRPDNLVDRLKRPIGGGAARREPRQVEQIADEAVQPRRLDGHDA